MFLIAPTLLVLTIVIVVPVFQSLYQSLHGQPGLDPQTGFVNDTEPFVGLRNYADIFTGGGDRFWNAFLNTTLFGVVTVLLETALGVIMALIMHKAMAGRGVVRAAILGPVGHPHRRLGDPVGVDLQPERRRQRHPGPAHHVGLG